jgi:hypothetical protein
MHLLKKNNNNNKNATPGSVTNVEEWPEPPNHKERRVAR